MTTHAQSRQEGPDAAGYEDGERTATPFDLFGPLPVGTSVLEASAGTGKTFTIAALVARYVAEGAARMDEVLVVSFSRDSARELRQRVRERLVDARDALADRPAAATSHDGSAAPVDELIEFLRDADPAEVVARQGRLAAALAEFDAATVTTTHAFCQQTLAALGTAGDHDGDVTVVEDLGDVLDEVVDDLYLRKWGPPGAGEPPLTRRQFRALAVEVVGDLATGLVPAPGEATGHVDLRVRIAGRLQEEVARRKRRARVIGYDDMPLRLARILHDPILGPVALGRMRNAYRVVLVDEFQDTDPVQWEILRAAFHGHRNLVLIGDPKQAIYRFRGADVHAYLDAKASAQSFHTLPTNWRSDAALLDGLTAVLGGAALGDPRIRVLPVDARHRGAMVSVPAGGPGAAPVRLRTLSRAGFRLKSGRISAPDARKAVARDLAAEIVTLLSDGSTVHPRAGGPSRPVEPGDIAVLVRDNSQAGAVQDVLQAVAVPAVRTGRTSVFATPAAQEWQVLLEALEQPHRTTRVRRLLLSCFVGATATDLGERGDELARDHAVLVRRWAGLFEQRGLAAVFAAVSASTSMPERVLSRPGGERLLTDLRHLGQTLHEAALDGGLGPTALRRWLHRRRAEADTAGGLERSRRLESDAAAVQVITVHTSKGLEFPVVMVPFAWNLWQRGDPETAVFHDDHGRRRRDVGGPGGPGWAAHAAAHVDEDTDEELRLAYVAMTRAQSRLVLWWAATANTATSPLHRLLLHDDPHAVAPRTVPVPPDVAALAAFRARAATSAGSFGVEVVVERPIDLWQPGRTARSQLQVGRFGRRLDPTWGRTSYSALTARRHGTAPSFGSEPEQDHKDDERDLDPAGAAGPGDDALREVPSAWADLPGGATFGTLVHDILERLAIRPGPTGSSAGDVLTDAVAEAVDAGLARFGGGDGPERELLGRALLTSLATPVADGRALAAFPSVDHLAELAFELPLAGGDGAADSRVTVSDLVPLWRRHCPAGPLAGYADALGSLAPAVLRGYLTGSIDAVLRTAGPGDRRYVVVDHKTNRLGAAGEPLTAWHYRPAALGRAMIDAHYPLQALLYTVALHRYLRWRVPGYDPGRHLGGVRYLFLRGMSGPDLRSADGSVPGVFAWQPPTGLVTASSDLLAGRT